jgi:CBS domain-containing protein
MQGVASFLAVESPEPRRVALHVNRCRLLTSSAAPARCTVFCPGQRRSIAVDVCATCEHVLRSTALQVECSPPDAPVPPRRFAGALRLDSHAFAGEAMGSSAICAYVDTPAGLVLDALTREQLHAAVVVDDSARCRGVVHRSDVEGAPPLASLHRLVRAVTPIHEAAVLGPAIARMVHDRARALPVVDDEGRPVGLLMDLDALRWVGRSLRP